MNSHNPTQLLMPWTRGWGCRTTRAAEVGGGVQEQTPPAAPQALKPENAKFTRQGFQSCNATAAFRDFWVSSCLLWSTMNLRAYFSIKQGHKVHAILETLSWVLLLGKWHQSSHNLSNCCCCLERSLCCRRNTMLILNH